MVDTSNSSQFLNDASMDRVSASPTTLQNYPQCQHLNLTIAFEKERDSVEFLDAIVKRDFKK